MTFKPGDKVRLISTNYATKTAGLSQDVTYTVEATDAQGVVIGGSIWPVYLFGPAVDNGPSPMGSAPIPKFLTNTYREDRAALEGLKGLEEALKTDLSPAIDSVEDLVSHPPHYARWAMEPIEFIAVNDLPWWVANVVKYCMRYDAKDGLVDLNKARTYIDMKIRQLEGHPRFWEQP
jgi:hypothetical protein